MKNFCRSCDGRGIHGILPRWDWILDGAEGSWLERFVVSDCEACGGDGFAKPPGWPNRDEIERLRPRVSYPPPKPKKPETILVREGFTPRMPSR